MDTEKTQLTRLEDVIEKYLPPNELLKVKRILFGAETPYVHYRYKLMFNI